MADISSPERSGCVLWDFQRLEAGGGGRQKVELNGAHGAQNFLTDEHTCCWKCERVGWEEGPITRGAGLSRPDHHPPGALSMAPRDSCLLSPAPNLCPSPPKGPRPSKAGLVLRPQPSPPQSLPPTCTSPPFPPTPGFCVHPSLKRSVARLFQSAVLSGVAPRGVSPSAHSVLLLGRLPGVGGGIRDLAQPPPVMDTRAPVQRGSSLLPSPAVRTSQCPGPEMPAIGAGVPGGFEGWVWRQE